MQNLRFWGSTFPIFQISKGKPLEESSFSTFARLRRAKNSQITLGTSRYIESLEKYYRRTVFFFTLNVEFFQIFTFLRFARNFGGVEIDFYIRFKGGFIKSRSFDLKIVRYREGSLCPK